MRVWILLLSCSWFWPHSAAAEAVVLWDADEGCPSAEQGRAEIAQLLNTPLSRVEVQLTAAVRIHRVSEGRFEARISVQPGESHERTLRDERCSVLAHAAAVVIALAIDPTAQLADGTASPEDSPTVASSPPSQTEATRASQTTPLAAAAGKAGSARETRAQPDPPPTAAASHAAADDDNAQDAAEQPSALPPRAAVAAPVSGVAAESPLRVYAAAAGALGVGMLARLGPQLAASVGLLTARWRAALHFGYAPAQRVTLADLPGVGGRVGLISAAIDGGLRLRTSALEVPLVVGLETGVFDAQGLGTADPTPRSPLWLAGYLGSGVSIPLGPIFAVSMRAEALVALRRPRFAVVSTAGDRRIFQRPSPVGGRLFFELELRLP